MQILYLFDSLVSNIGFATQSHIIEFVQIEACSTIPNILRDTQTWILEEKKYPYVTYVCPAWMLGTLGANRGLTDQRVLVLVLKFLVLKKTRFFPVKNISQICFDFSFLYSMQLFSADTTLFSKKIKLPKKTQKKGLKSCS